MQRDCSSSHLLHTEETSPPRIRAGPGACPGTLSNDGESVPCTRGDERVQFYLENKLVHRKMTGHERDHGPLGGTPFRASMFSASVLQKSLGLWVGPMAQSSDQLPSNDSNDAQTGGVGEAFSDPSPADGSAPQAPRHPSIKQRVKRQGKAEGSSCWNENLPCSPKGCKRDPDAGPARPAAGAQRKHIPRPAAGAAWPRAAP